MNNSINHIKKSLEELGVVFTAGERSTQGEYSSSDVEWNYNDVPHLNEVHQLANAVQGAISDNDSVSIYLQKIGPLRFPMSVFISSISRFENCYFTTLGPFILLIQTKWSSVESKTLVVTRYWLGSGKMLKWTHKTLFKFIYANYENLMSGDVPMRSRRGELRSRGYLFGGDFDGYSFSSSMKLNSRDVRVPELLERFEWRSAISEVNFGSTLIGADDNSGVRLDRHENIIRVFPRICMHAGARLDFGESIGSCIKCPWHGNLIKPIFVIDLNIWPETYVSNGISVEVQKLNISIAGRYEV